MEYQEALWDTKKPLWNAHSFFSNINKPISFYGIPRKAAWNTNKLLCNTKKLYEITKSFFGIPRTSFEYQEAPRNTKGLLWNTTTRQGIPRSSMEYLEAFLE